jgi:Asp-tRNA(Asn)/Glu-tRNA(Gln) amidotransferase A subunit family amidase
MSSARDRLEAILASAAARYKHCVFLKLYPDAARAAADAADCRRKAGVTLGPLDGKIVSIKDLFDVAGEPTTAGLFFGAPLLQPRPMLSLSAAFVRQGRSSSVRPTCRSSRSTHLA